MSATAARTDRLLALMEKHDLSCSDVSRLTGRVITTVYVWRNGAHYAIPETMLQLLEFKVGAAKTPKGPKA